MSDDADKKAGVFFQTGDKAVGRGDFDYAIECFSNCCKLVPSKLIYRQALRGAQRKKHNNNGKGVSMAALRMKPAQAKMMMAKRSNKWKDFVDAAEEALALNPWDSQVLYEQGCALHEMGLLDIATWVLETAQDNKTGDIYRRLADVYEESEQFDKAIRTWETVSKVDPSDENALTKMRQLAASATIQRGKFEDNNEEGGSAQRNISSQAPESFEARIAREIKEIKQKIEAEPTNASLFRELGESYRRLGQMAEAAAAYEQGFHATGDKDVDLQIRWKEMLVEPKRRELAEAEQLRKQVDPKEDPERAQKIIKFIRGRKADICRQESEIYRLKLSLNADDFSSHYELGYRALQLGELDDAIKNLQKGRNDTQRKWQALLYLGVAFRLKKNYALAEKNLADAMDAVSSANEEGRKEILYYRGLVALDAGDQARALEYFNEIAAMDYEYKDVAKRIDEINAG